MPPAENRAARRRATRRADVEVGAAYPFRCEPVDVRRLRLLVTIARQIAIAEIVDEEQEDVGRRCTGRARAGSGAPASESQEQAEDKAVFHVKVSRYALRSLGPRLSLRGAQRRSNPSEMFFRYVSP